ncbi:MAG TPA: cation diffusion facilitator family transporter [Aggregatilineales bacterium]|nr:cation diffusion facilitator family transporter [Anaerolineales bacterium]HRE47306.1 cation diffusion facilitator family transporter [Aggregatilineales bacterium]
MSAPPLVSLPDAERFRHVQRTLWLVLIANAGVAGAKIVIGVLTGTLAMVADGFHSTMDAASNLVGIAASRVAGRPPDADHPYGHRRFETLATLTIGGLLLVAAWEILTSALDRLLHGGKVEVSILNVAVMVITILVNLTVVLYETRQGKRLRSPVLLADASQTRVDIYISFSVIIGLAMTAFGFAWMDTVIALLIVVLIGRAAFVILKQTTGILTDRIALDPALIERVALSVPGVTSVTRARSRGPGDAVQADVEVRVDPSTTADRANALAEEIERRLRAENTGVIEVQVQFTPNRPEGKDHALAARAAADAMGLSIHEVTEILSAEGRILEMHVEVPPTLTLRQAHEKVSALEERVCADLPAIVRVVTHIEPAEMNAGSIMQSEMALILRDRALQIAQERYPTARFADAQVRAVMAGYALSVSCQLPGTMSVQEAHLIAEEMETHIRASLPELRRVTIHTEPDEQG